jgi:hypothetical protein
MKANLEYANAGKTDITINNNPNSNSKNNYNESKLSDFDMIKALLTNEKELESSQFSNLDNLPLKPNSYFIVARNYVDFNKNRQVAYSEFIDASKYAYVVSKSNPLKFYLVRKTNGYSNKITNITIYDLMENGKEVKNSPVTTLGKPPLKEIILNDEYFPKTSNYRVALNIKGRKSLFLDVAVVTEKDYQELSESNKE